LPHSADVFEFQRATDVIPPALECSPLTARIARRLMSAILGRTLSGMDTGDTATETPPHNAGAVLCA
jgi:hypothetical protein